MSGRYCYDFPRPSVTVDVVALTMRSARLHVLLIRRAGPPFAGQWALPGGFVDMDEEIEDAAQREFHEETGLSLSKPLAFLDVFGRVGRDPRGRTISLAYGAEFRAPGPEAQGGDDAAEAAWVEVAQAHPLAFDHAEILRTGLRRVERSLRENPEIALEILPDPCGNSDILGLFHDLGLSAAKASAWRRELVAAGRIHPTGGRPPRFRLANASQPRGRGPSGSAAKPPRKARNSRAT